MFERSARAVRDRGVGVGTHLERAHAPGGVLAGIARAQHSPVVVAATRNRDGMTRVMAGSTTMTLLHASTCPVVVVPDRAELQPGVDAPASACCAAR
jgi:nucleotide-binding universal stress UspA family protein